MDFIWRSSYLKSFHWLPHHFTFQGLHTFVWANIFRSVFLVLTITAWLPGKIASQFSLWGLSSNNQCVFFLSTGRSFPVLLGQAILLPLTALLQGPLTSLSLGILQYIINALQGKGKYGKVKNTMLNNMPLPTEDWSLYCNSNLLLSHTLSALQKPVVLPGQRVQAHALPSPSSVSGQIPATHHLTSTSPIPFQTWFPHTEWLARAGESPWKTQRVTWTQPR